MILSTPLWLWLLSALSIPVAIHLWNRKSGKPHLLGTFRFLPDDSFAKASRMELHEIPLLILRMLLIFVLALLLAELFWVKEKESVETVYISESENSGTAELERDNSPEIFTTPETTDQAGWWNLVKQAEHDYRPNSIIVTGSFSQNRFKGARPELFADITWNNVPLPRNRAEAAWQIENGDEAAYVQERNSRGVKSKIQTASNIELLSVDRVQHNGDTLRILDPMRFTINSELDTRIITGLEFTAETWSFTVDYEPLGESVIGQISAGEESFEFSHQKDSNGPSVVVSTNPLTGIQFPVNHVDSTYNPSHILIESDNHIPVLWIQDEHHLHLNGEIPSELRSWIFAAASHQWVKNILGINIPLLPEMMDEQRQVNRVSTPSFAGSMENKSLRSLLFLLLILLWGTERVVAPNRGM